MHLSNVDDLHFFSGTAVSETPKHRQGKQEQKTPQPKQSKVSKASDCLLVHYYMRRVKSETLLSTEHKA